MAKLTAVFGNSVRVKVLEFLLNNPGKLFSQSEISRQVGCSVSSAGRALGPLEQLAVVRVLNLPGEAKVVALNPESPITLALLKLREDLR